MKHYFLAALVAMAFVTANAQEPDLKKINLTPPVLDSDSLLNEGVKLHDDEKYEAAIALFEQINENDSTYINAQVELANTYLALKKDSAALAICKRFKNANPSLTPNFILIEANAYEDLKQYPAAEKAYLEGAALFPYNPKFYHELAVCCTQQKKYKEARDYFIKALGINRNYTPSHFQLGVLALKQKKIIPAMLSWQYYLLLDNNSQRAQKIIKYLEQIGDDNIDYNELGTIDPIDNNDDFSDLESIVKSKAAYNDNFKSEVKVNFRVLKQIQVVLSKLEYNADDKGYYNQFYAKFFKELVDKKFTVPYLYYIMSEMKVDDVDKWMKNNKDKIEAFGTWMNDYMHKNYDEITYNDKGTSIKMYKLYSNNTLDRIGNYDDKGNPYGKWKYFYKSSTLLKTEGNFNAKGEREGEWKYYYNSQHLRELCQYKADKLEGEYYMYHNNGKVYKHYFYKTGEYDGKQTVYYANGNIKGTYDYKNGVFEGEEQAFYKSGRLKYKVPVKAGLYEGTLTYYNESGSLYKTAAFVGGKHQGKYTEYHRSTKGATVYAEGNYENDFQTGEWKYYFDNGKLYMVGVFNKKGLKDGVWKEYNRDGVLISEDSYSDDRREGVSKNFYDDGKVYEEYSYRKNKINSYKYLDKSGKVLKESTKVKNEFSFDLYNQNGTLKRSGKVIGEELDSKFTDYNYLGIKTDESEYKNGEKINKEYSYFSNGQVREETPIENGRSNGLFTEYFADGKVATKGYMVDGQANGYWFYYMRSGALSEIRYYVRGEKHGWQRDYTCSGNLFKIDYVVGGTITQRRYYDTLGKMTTRINYDSCAPCSYTVPNFEGKVAMQRSINNNGLNGAWINYYPNGKVHKQASFETDLENGLTKNFDPLGNISLESNYDYDNLSGKYTVYDYGKPTYSATYKNDNLSGEVTYYFESGKPSATKTYVNDDLNGPVTEYDDEGNVAAVLNYKANWVMSYSYQNEAGQLLLPIEVTKPETKIETFYKNKKPALSYSLKNGSREGKYVKYAASGMKIEESTYTSGYLNGVKTTYYASGKVKSKANYVYGDYDGKYTEYYENGNLKEELTYLNGSRHGVSTYYDVNGKVLVKYFYYDGLPMKTLK